MQAARPFHPFPGIRMNMFDLTARRARLGPDRLALEDLADGTRYTLSLIHI